MMVSGYSDLRLIVGFERAALRMGYPTVIMVSKKVVNAAPENIRQSGCILYANDASQACAAQKLMGIAITMANAIILVNSPETNRRIAMLLLPRILRIPISLLLLSAV